MRPFPVIHNFKHYFWRKLIPAIIIVISGILFLNFFLAYRLENYLKKEIRERVATATDNFYTLTFDDLKIHLVSGELSIEGIHLAPDTNTFQAWQAKDSLPLNYIKTDIQQIEFKGINLIWLKNYRKLNFNAFNITNPTVEIIDAFYSDRHERKVKTARNKTLHEFIEPYIDILSVDRFNIDDAYVSFLVEHPFSPIHYTLDKFDFQGINFQLDSTSFTNGKLLYMDDFEFYTVLPQLLIRNNSFLLETDSIRLSTIDSLFLLKNIRLIPHEKFWLETHKTPESYQSGSIETLQVEGLDFERYNAENYLNASDLKIISADLHIHSFSTGRKGRQQTQSESFLPSLSLHELISPLLNELKIGQITMEDASLDYLSLSKDSIESVKIDNLDLTVWDLVIDSTGNKRKPFPYFKEFRVNANGINMHLPDQNQKVIANTLSLDTRQGVFLIRDIQLASINQRWISSYATGKIDSVYIGGLSYDQDLKLDKLIVASPEISYYTSGHRKKANANTPEIYLPEYFQEFYGKEIWIKDANLRIVDRTKSSSGNFQLKNTTLYGRNFFLNEQTLKYNSLLPFDLEEYGFSLTDFDNSLAGNYRLQIRKAGYNSQTDKIQANDIRLTPLNRENSYIELSTPYIQITGTKDLLHEPDFFKIDSIHIDAPHLAINQQTANTPDTLKKEVKEHTPFNPFRQFSINRISLNDTRIEMANKAKQQQLTAAYDLLKINGLNWNTDNNRNIHLQYFHILNPDVLWESGLVNNTTPKNESKTLPEILHPFAESFIIDELSVSGINFKTRQPYLTADIPVKNFQVDSLHWAFNIENRYLQANRIKIDKPDLLIQREMVLNKPEKEVNDTIKKDLYSQLLLLGDDIRIKELDISEAEIDYSMKTTIRKDINQKINHTWFRLNDMVLDNKRKKFSYDDIYFYTKNLSVPIDNGFYDLQMSTIKLDGNTLQVDSFHMVSPLPKTEFAKIHPKHTDWFDVSVEKLRIKDIDLQKAISDSLFYASHVIVDNPVLLNYKNKQIYTPPRFMPMIYEGLQKAPIKVNLERIDVNNLGVIYEELALKATRPGRLRFTELNGTLTGFTNIVSYPEQYMKLKADGKFYGQGHFNAVWLLPVDSLNDRFILDAHLPDMDMTLLNEMITPLASPRLKSGQLNDFTFHMDAGSIGGSIDMLFLYDSLKADIFKEENGTIKSKKFLNFLVNAVVRDNNPNKPGKKPRQSSVTIIRDPYHSSFNYLWQLLRPALTESVGITQTQQKIAGKTIGFITKVKNLFSKKNDNSKKTIETTDEKVEN